MALVLSGTVIGVAVPAQAAPRTEKAASATAQAGPVSPSYAITDLGVFADGGTDTYATGVNNAGVVTGYGNHAAPGFTAFEWNNGTLTDLGTLGCSAYGRAINSTDTVVGSYGCTLSAGFQTNGTTMEGIGGLSAGQTTADAVNASGQIAGASNDADNVGRAYVSAAGGIGLQAIDSVASEAPNTRTIEAFGVNTAGDAAGLATFDGPVCGGSHYAPFLYSGGQVQDLTGSSGCSGQANALNDSDQVVGYEELTSGVDHAFLWNGTMQDLGTPNANLAESDAYAINAGGTIVGDAQGSPESLPVAWVLGPTGGMQLLNDLIDPSVGWDVMVASGINDRGQIVGWGAHDGGYHAFEMTPMVAKTLTGITVTPATATLPKGTSQQFTATGTYSDGSTADVTGAVTWSSSKPKVAIITASGDLSALKGGTTTVTATDGPTSGSTTVKVGPATLVSIAVTPTSTSTPPGSTVQFSAMGTYSDGSTKDLTTLGKWKSSATKVATIGSRSGLATAKKDGSTTITFDSHSLPAATATLTVAPVVSE